MFSVGSPELIIHLVMFKPMILSTGLSRQTLCSEVILEQKGHKVFEELVTFSYLVVLILKICNGDLLQRAA